MRIFKFIDRPATIDITVDGEVLTAHPGESLAVALRLAGMNALRSSPRTKQQRGAFCFMGVCQECVITVNGKRALACQTPVRKDQIIETGARSAVE